MPEFAVESKRQPMTSTGIVNPVMEWGQDDKGKRFKTDRQQRDPDTGMPVWDFEVMYVGSNFGQDCTVTANVTVGAAEKPNPSPLTPVTFEGLRVSVFINKANGLAERWEAEAIGEMTERPAGKSDSASSNGASTSAKSSASSSSSSAAA